MAFNDSAGLLFRIKGDASDAVRAFTETKAAETELAGATGGLTSSFSSMIGPATAAAAIVGGIGIAAFAAGEKLLHLAEAAADYGSKIHDAAQQTGLSVQNIQALKFAAEQSGSSFEAVTGAAAKFSAVLGEAKNGNQKAIDTLNQYHIAIGDTNTAIQEAIKNIASMTDHDQRAAAAKDLFRDRAAAILPVIESFDGDMPSLIKHLQDLGILMSQEDTDAADKFGDQMDELSKQFEGVKIKIGTELMPVFNDWAKDLSDWLKSNPGQVQSWGKNFVTVLQAVGNAVQILVTDFQILNEWSSNLINTPKYYQLLDQLAVLEEKDKAFWEGRNIQPGTRNVNDQVNELTTPIDRSKVVTPGRDPEAQKKLDDEAKKAAEERRKAREKEVQEAIASAEKSNRAFLSAERERYATEQEELEKAFLDHEKTAEEYRDKSVENIKKYAATVRNLIENAFVIDSSQAKNQADMDAAEAERTARISALKRETDKEAADAIKNIEDQRKKAESDKEKAAKDEEKRLENQIELWKKEGKAYADLIDGQNEKLSELQDKVDEVQPAIDELLQTLFDQDLAQNGIPGADNKQPTIFDGWLDSWHNFFETVKAESGDLTKVLTTFASITQDAFNGIANAIGNVIQNWVLYGTTGPAVMRKVLASALATIAAEAAVRAIYATALGFLYLAMGDFYSAGQAFIAAGVFAAIAGVAALAGRAVAGNAFKQQTNTATGHASGGGTSGGGSGYYSSQSNTVKEEGRSQPGLAGQVAAHVEIHLKDDSKWLGNMLEFQIATNSGVRKAIKNA